ncbi:hypothetical protein HGM15179_000830 [Zosterops borbonicus]|uniref:Uncharacterized protein n=1 Tax=Zosterops borbonicus TaxID=364589 RepID=A0A8K1GXJ2_9PASS|nr:hypothetical protein HGM15179_000830 [Zosterops borbonicus]
MISQEWRSGKELPVAHASFDGAQAITGFLGCKHALSGHFELLVNHIPQSPPLGCSPFSAQPVFVLGVTPTHVQDLALGLVELYEVHTIPPLHPVKLLFGGISSLQRVDCTTQLSVTRKLAEAALNPTVHVTNKDVKQCQSQY